MLRLVWPLPLSLATTRGISFDFSSSGYLDVSVPRVPLAYLLIQYAIHDSSSCVFPHSEICGSKLICSSPQLIAACHVLRRLPMPRHSPYALVRLNYLPKMFGLSGSLLYRLNCYDNLHFTVNSFLFASKNCFFTCYFSWKNLISLNHFLPFTMSVMCIISYSVFNEHWFLSLSEHVYMFVCQALQLHKLSFVSL